MSEVEKKFTTKFRFECLKCHTKIELVMPFRRKPCPLCGRAMSMMSQVTVPIEEKKGGETA